MTGPAVDAGYNPVVIVRVHGEDVSIGESSVYQSKDRVNGVPAGTRAVTVQGPSGAVVSQPVTVRVDRTTLVPTIHTS